MSSGTYCIVSEPRREWCNIGRIGLSIAASYRRRAIHIQISNPNDPRVAAYRDIRERDLVGRQGRFVAEGTVVLRHLLGSRRFAIESILVLENRLRGLGDLLARVPAGVPVYVATRDVLDTIAGFPMHRGVLAIGLRGSDATVQELLDRLTENATLVVCIGIANHDNIGAIFRNAAAFGANAVLLDPTCCDPLYRKAIRVSVGAALAEPFARFDVPEALVKMLAERQFLQLALTPAGGFDIRSVTRAARTALYVGAEGPGLPRSLIDRLVGTRISMAPDFDSLNVAAATAIALHCLGSGAAQQT